MTTALKLKNTGGAFDMGGSDSDWFQRRTSEPSDHCFVGCFKLWPFCFIARKNGLFTHEYSCLRRWKKLGAKQMQEILLWIDFLVTFASWFLDVKTERRVSLSRFFVENKAMLQQATSIQLSICLNPVVLFVALGKKNWAPVLKQGQLSFRQFVRMFATNGNNLMPTTIPTLISLLSHEIVVDGTKIEHPLSLIARLRLAVESSKPLIINPGVNVLDSRMICAVAINAVCQAAENFLPEDKEYWLRVMSEHDSQNGTDKQWTLEQLTERLQRDKAERFVGDHYEYFDMQSDVSGVKAQQQRFAARGETSSAGGGSSSSGTKTNSSKKRGQRNKRSSSNGSSSADGAGTVTLASDKMSIKELQLGKQIIAALHISGMEPVKFRRYLMHTAKEPRRHR